MRRRNLLWSAVLPVALAILFFKFSIVAAIIFAAAALVGVIINPSLYDRRYRNNLRKIYKEKLGAENEFTCEVELLPEGIKTSGRNFNGTAQWKDVAEIPPL